jgi:hypothetical protein
MHPRVFATGDLAKMVIVEWIEVFYNRKRLHSSLNYLSPVQFEQQYYLTLNIPVSTQFNSPFFWDKVSIHFSTSNRFRLLRLVAIGVSVLKI